MKSDIHKNDDTDKMDFFDPCSFLNLKSVLRAGHFQCRKEVFFQVIALDGPLGKTKYHAVCAKFQVRGSPNFHSFLWVLNAPALSKDNINQYIFIADNIATTSLPDVNNESQLFELVATYRDHFHSKSGRKYKNHMCCYNFERFFTDRKIVEISLPSDMSEITKKNSY